MSVTIPEPDGCPWPIDPGCLEDDWETEYTEETQARSVALASATLRRLCAFRVGGCPITIRPARRSVCLPLMGMYGSSYDMGRGFLPYNVAGRWSNAWCGCDEVDDGRSIELLPPVGGVTEVKVDGDVLDEDTDYWVSGNRLIRLGGEGWPLTQDLNLPDTADGTFSVTYLNSYPVDGMGAYAAGLLAMQYAKACNGGECDLPSTVTSIVRQGVSYDLAAGSFPNGETGIREVDAYIALWNPGHRRQPPRVWVP